MPHLGNQPGPFRADQLRSGDPYELSNGHPILCLPKGGRAGRARSVGASVLASDPAGQDVGVDIGFSPSPETLRASDISVGELPDQPGWVQGAPQRQGYSSLDEVRAEGETHGRAEGEIRRAEVLSSART